MKYLVLMVLFFTLISYATQWQPPETVNGLSSITGLNLSSANTVMYCAKWHDGYWGADIGYYSWSGSTWVWVDWVQGDVNTTDDEEEPFITYDGQHLYFQRYDLYDYVLYKSDWDGNEFVNSSPLNSNINQGNSRYPSLTQDSNFLYFTKSGWIYVSEWNGLDWGVPTEVPNVNLGGGLGRTNVTITPDSNEIYFKGAGSYPNGLAFSKNISDVWQPWQYCDYNINPPSNPSIAYPAFTYSSYANQYLYFYKNVSPYYYRALRSPVAVEPASLGQIKANYAR